MKISIRLAQLLQRDLYRRGLIAEIEKETGIERHTVAGMLNNTVKYVSIEALAKISDYLIRFHGVDPQILPGALLGRDPERFWEMLAECERLDFCLGYRISEEWQGTDHVMATDSHLQGVLLSKISSLGAGRETGPGGGAGREVPSGQAPSGESPGSPRYQRLPRFHLVPAPHRDTDAQDPGDYWKEIVRRASELYEGGTNDPVVALPAQAAADDAIRGAALVALGSVKVNPVVELMLAHAFSAAPFDSQDNGAKAGQRRGPIFFRYRDTDPKPPSFCGGLHIAADTPAPEPGVYYQAERNRWKCVPWNEDASDAAFLFYAFYPRLARLEVACGGFSSRATNCLTEELDHIVSGLGEPQFTSRQIVLGLYVIEFTFGSPPPPNPRQDSVKCESRVIRIPDAVIRRHLGQWQ